MHPDSIIRKFGDKTVLFPHGISYTSKTASLYQPHPHPTLPNIPQLENIAMFISVINKTVLCTMILHSGTTIYYFFLSMIVNLGKEKVYISNEKKETHWCQTSTHFNSTVSILCQVRQKPVQWQPFCLARSSAENSNKQSRMR